MIYNYINSLFLYHWPPDQTISTIPENANFIVAWHYLQFDVILVLVALLWGIGFCSLLLKHDRTLKAPLHFSTLAFICTGLGFALIIAELFLLVLLHALTPHWVMVLFSVTSIAACYHLVLRRQEINQIMLPVSKSGSVAGVLIILMLFFYQISSAALWQLNDSTSYHIPYADFFLLNKGLSSIPEQLIYPYQSLNLNLLYSLGLMIDRDLSYLQTLNALFATLTIFGIYAFCVSTGQRLFLAICVPVIFISNTPEIYFNRFGANVDCGSMFFVMCSTITLYMWIKSRSQWLLIASAITLGIAMGTKYLMCIFALPIAICLLITAGRHWKPTAIYIAWAAAWGLWWYIRNFIYTGNPVHPFASNIFGLYLWDQNDVQIQMQGLLETRIPRTITGLLLMPFYACQDSLLSFLGASLIICLLYVSTIFSWLLNRATNCILVFCWIYLIAWFLGAQDPRYLMPIMPLVFVYSGCVINAVFNKFLLTKTGKVTAGIATLTACISTGIFLEQEFIKIFNSDIGSSPQVKEERMRHDPLYDLISHANEIFGDKATVYEFFFRNARWFFKGNLVGNQFGPHGYYRMINNSVKDNGDPGLSPEKLEKNLTEKYSASGFMLPNPPNMPYLENEFNAYFILMYKNEAGSIYKFKKHL